MPSLTDIPGILLPASARVQFLDWLTSLIAETWAKKELMMMWAEYNETRWTVHEVKSIIGEW